MKLSNRDPNPFSAGWSFLEISATAFSPSSPSGLSSMARIRSLHRPVRGTTASPMLSLLPMTSRSNAEMRSFAFVTGMVNRYTSR